MNRNGNKDALPTAFVIGLESMTGLQTARILARHGVPVIGLTRDPSHPCCRTRACERVIAVGASSDALIDVLVRLGRDLPDKSVVYPCSDAAVSVLSSHRAELADRFHIALPKHETVEMLMDKAHFFSFAKAHGLPVPLTLSISSRNEAREAANELRYPCILKPTVRTPLWEKHSKAKVYRLADRKSFLETYDHCASLAETLIAQEWIDGPDCNLYSCNCYYNAQSVPLVTFVARKLRQWPPEAGTSCLGEECRNDVVLDHSLRLFHEAGFHGLGYVEVKQDSRSGKYFIVEPNVGRPTGRSAIAEAGGIDLLYTMYCDLLGRPLPPNRSQSYGKAKWVYFRRDLQSAFYYWRRGQLTAAQWVKSLQGIRSDAIFSWSDPQPFVFDVAHAATSALRRSSRPLS